MKLYVDSQKPNTECGHKPLLPQALLLSLARLVLSAQVGYEPRNLLCPFNLILLFLF